LFVHGRYWHGTKQQAEDKLKFAEIMSLTRNAWFEPVIIWDDESDTVEKAFQSVRKVLKL
jgi:hypothetical protein